MKENAVDITKRIEETYSLVFKKNYTYDKETLDYSFQLVKKDMQRLGISDLSELNNYCALNVGTGSESIALKNLGADEVYHVDVSSVAVNSMKKYIEDSDDKKLHTNLFDLCSSEKMNFIKRKCNLVYLNGVLQHLYNPFNAITNIAKNMETGGRIFIRTYRNESWLFFMVTMLRELFKYTDKNSLLEYCIKNSKGEDIYSDLYVCEMFDDIFVPVINIYSYKELVNFFEKLGYEEIKIGDQTITENNIPYVEKQDTEESIMIAFKKIRESNNVLNSFPEPKYQLNNFKDNEEIQLLINKYNLLLKKIEEREELKLEVPRIIYELYGFASFRRERIDDLKLMIKNVNEYIEKIIEV